MKAFYFIPFLAIAFSVSCTKPQETQPTPSEAVSQPEAPSQDQPAEDAQEAQGSQGAQVAGGGQAVQEVNGVDIQSIRTYLPLLEADVKKTCHLSDSQANDLRSDALRASGASSPGDVRTESQVTAYLGVLKAKKASCKKK